MTPVQKIHFLREEIAHLEGSARQARQINDEGIDLFSRGAFASQLNNERGIASLLVRYKKELEELLKQHPELASPQGGRLVDN